MESTFNGVSEPHPFELLDPTFVPPGNKLSRHSSVLGTTTIIKKARLVAVVYRAKDSP